MAKKKTLWLLLIILIIATFLRLYHFTGTPPGLYPDEAVNGNNALTALRSGDFKVFYPDNNGREGLFIDVQSGFMGLMGSIGLPGSINEPWVLRLPSALAGILTVLGIYFLASEFFGPATGLLAAFFLATSFWHINFSRIGFRAILAPLFLVWAVYFLLRAMGAATKFLARSAKQGGAGGYILYSLIGGAVFGLGFYTYIAYRVMPLLIPFVIIYYLKQRWQSIRSRKMILLSAFYFLLSAFLIALPIGIYFLAHPADFLGRTAQVSVFRAQNPVHDLVLNVAKTALMFNFRGDYNWRHNISGSPELFWPVGILFLLGIAVGIFLLWREWRKHKIARWPNDGSPAFSFLFIFLWMFLASLPVVISNEGLPHALRSILLLPPAIIFAAIGGVKIYGFMLESGARKIIKILACVFLLAIALSAYIQYFVVWAKNPNVQGAFSADYVETGKEINSLPETTPKYVVVEAGGVLVNGIPMPAQTVMFITDTFSPEKQASKNIHYFLPNEENNVPAGAREFYVK